jgi:hypothetical protein
MRKIIAALVLMFCSALPAFGQAPGGDKESALSSVAGVKVAVNYNFSPLRIATGPVAAASPASFQLTYGYVKLADGRTIAPFFVGDIVKIGEGSTAENVTLTAVTSCGINAPQGSCVIAGNTVNAHGQGDVVASGSMGLDEAIYDSSLFGGGLVVIDPVWASQGGTSAMITAAQVFPAVAVDDKRSYAEQYWVPQGSVTVLGTPTTLTAVTALPSATPVGAFGTGTYHMCIAYVDVMGQEGTCSADFSQAGLATGSFIFSPPAASAGAVGYTIYIGLTGGGVTNLDYKVPLVTQPTVIGAYPVSNGVCTLTTVELTTPACAVTNTNYGQTGATATVTVITLATSPINPQNTIVSTTSIYVPNPGGRTAYLYVPGSHIGTPGLPAGSLAFPLTTAEVTVVPDVAGTINLPPGFMNYVGRTLELCGEITATATAATIVDVQFQWDSIGANNAGKGVLIGDLTGTPSAALASTGHVSFCQDFQTTVASASATGGSINHIGGGGGVAGVTVAGSGGLGDVVTPGAIGSLNLADDARINVIMLHTTATDGAGWILQSLTAKVVN